MNTLERLEEKGIIRRVRTAAGARRFGQPIGTIITRDMASGLGNKRKKRRTARVEKASARVKKAANSTGTMQARSKGPNPTPGEPKGATARLMKKGILEEPRQISDTRWSQYGSDGVHGINIRSEGGQSYAEVGDSRSTKKFTGGNYDEVRDKAARYLEGIHKRMSTPGDEYDEWGYWPVNREYRDYDALPEAYQGIRGRDWWEEGDPEWDSGEEWDRWDLIELESEAIGVKIDHQDADMDPEFAMSVLAVLRAHEEMYPGLMKYLEKIEVGAPKGRALGWNGPMYTVDEETGKYAMKSRIGFPSHLAGYQSGGNAEMGRSHSAGLPNRVQPEWRGTKVPKNFRESGWMAVTKQDLEDAFPDIPEGEEWRAPLSYVVTHEVGHMMGFMLMGDLPVNPEKREDWEALRKEFVQEFLELLEEYAILKDANVDNPEMISRNTGRIVDTRAVFEHLSEYGGTNFHEIMAESWAAYQMDENPGDFVRGMGELLEDVMAEYLEIRDY